MQEEVEEEDAKERERVEGGEEGGREIPFFPLTRTPRREGEMEEERGREGGGSLPPCDVGEEETLLSSRRRFFVA